MPGMKRFFEQLNRFQLWPSRLRGRAVILPTAEHTRAGHRAVGPDWAIYWTLGKFSKSLATINLPQSPTFLGNFCKGIEIFHFSSEISFGPLFIYIWQLFTGHT